MPIISHTFRRIKITVKHAPIRVSSPYLSTNILIWVCSQGKSYNWFGARFTRGNRDLKQSNLRKDPHLIRQPPVTSPACLAAHRGDYQGNYPAVCLVACSTAHPVAPTTACPPACLAALPVAHQESYREEHLSADPEAHTVPCMSARPIALLAACLEALPVDCPVDNPEFCLTACSGPIIWQIPTHFSHPLPSNPHYPCVEPYPYSSREHTTASRIPDMHTLATIPYGSGNPHPTVQSRELYQPFSPFNAALDRKI